MREEIKTEEAGTDNNQEEKKQKKSIEKIGKSEIEL